MRVPVIPSVSQVLHQPGRCIAQVRRHRTRAVLPDEGLRGLPGDIRGVGLRSDGQIEHRLRQRQLALGRAEPLVGLRGVQRDAQRARIGQADVLAGHAHQAPGDVARVGAAVDHAREPVQRAVRAAAAHRLVQRRDRVEELVAALVVAAQLRTQTALERRLVQRPVGAGHAHHVLEGVEQPARIAVGIGDQALRRGGLRGGRGQRLAGSRQQRQQLGLAQRLEHMHRRARQQRRVDLEGRVLGRRTDEGEQTRLDMRQEGVLLRLVEAVHLVDEDDAAPPPRLRALRALDRLADVLDPAQHRGDRHEVGVEGLGGEPRQRRLAHARRAPQDHRMRPARHEGRAQRLARAQQVGLADHLVDVARAQPLGQRRLRRGRCARRPWRMGVRRVGRHIVEQVVHCPRLTAAARRRRPAR